MGKTNQLQFELTKQIREPLVPLRLSCPAGKMGPAKRTAARTYCIMVPSRRQGATWDTELQWGQSSLRMGGGVLLGQPEWLGKL